MKAMSLFFRRERAIPMLALAFASTASIAVVAARILWTGEPHCGFLIWNLFLAWLPLVFAVLACDCYTDRTKQSIRFKGYLLGWLLFFPNAPYILTDLIHLTTTRFYAHYWVDLVLILMCAFTGLIIGFLSLYLMQSVVTGMFGRLAGWIFVVAAAGLGSFGTFMGRFLRFNSWDVLTKPMDIYRGVGVWTANSLYAPASIGFPVLFAAFLLIAYIMLYALTHLSPSPQIRARSSV
jgi:uncharacterized membrane protein